MDTQNTNRQLRYLEEVRIPLHRACFGTLPLEGDQLPVLWNGAPLCRITGKGSVFYRREDADAPQAEDALYRVEDIAAKTLEYMTAMETAPQLKASGLDGDYRILADFGGTVLAGTPSKYGVQFVTWDWDYDRTGVVHGHYFMENYDGAKQDFATRSGLIQKEQLFSPEQLTEIFRCCAVRTGSGRARPSAGGSIGTSLAGADNVIRHGMGRSFSNKTPALFLFPERRGII